MSGALFVDTSAWIARLAAHETGHTEIAAAMDATTLRFCTTNFVLDESVTLARARYGHRAAVMLAGVLTSSDVALLHRISADDERAALELFRDRPDQLYSFTDCTSFVVMRRLGIDTALTLDGDFAREGFRVVP